MRPERVELTQERGAEHVRGKVATRPTQVTDADFEAARAAGFSEDEVFELVICAAVGQSARLYNAGLAALADAVAGEEDG